MQILLLGHRGYLGSYIHNHLKYQHDITAVSDHYDYIINCVGRPNLEYCEVNPKESYVSNYSYVIPFIDRYPESKIINFSSYYVYDDVGLCVENSNVTYRYVYTKHKLLCEEIVGSHGISFRLGKVFGNVEFVGKGKLTEYIVRNDVMVLDSVKFNPVSVQQIVKVIDYEIENDVFEGIYNLANSGTPTHYEYGTFINCFFGDSKNIKQIDKMNRDFHNYGKFLMSLEKISKFISLTDWREDLYKYLEELKYAA